MGRSHPLGSRERTGDAYELGKRSNRTNPQGRQASHPTAWGSGDHILDTDADIESVESRPTKFRKDIVVAQEITVTHEAADATEKKVREKGTLGHHSSVSAFDK